MDIQLLTVVEENELKNWPAERWAKYQLEPKYDGARLIYKRGEFFSRSGKPLHNLEHIKKELDEIPGIENCVLDGELHGANWSETMSIARASKSERNGEALTFHVFDCLPTSNFERKLCDQTLEKRRSFLAAFLFRPHSVYVKITGARCVLSYEKFKSYYEDCLARGCDGVVLKDIHSLYAFKRSKDWLKVKPILTADCEIVGMEVGKGKYKGTLGALEIRPEGSTMTTMCSGMRDEMRDELWGPPTKYIGAIIEVKYRGLHKSGRLIEPRFVRMRPDKEKVA